MSAARINHVSVHAIDLAASTAFYVELLGAQPIPSPNFGVPVQWLALGDTQLHLFVLDATPAPHHHFAVTVDDLEPVYRRAAALGCLDNRLGHHLNELPGGIVQLYLRDPAGNLLEVDAAGARRLAADLRAELQILADAHPQDHEQRSARLFLGMSQDVPGA